MNPRYHHHNIPQPHQPFYYNPYLVSPSQFAYNQEMSPARYYNPGSRFVEYVDDVALLINTPNTLIHYPWVMINQQHDMHHSSSYLHNYNYDQYHPTQENTSFDSSSDDYSRAYEEFLEESLLLLNLLEAGFSQQQETAAGGASGSGLPKEKILEHLQVYTVTQGKNFAEGEESVDVCSICLDDYGKKEKMGILECGHRYHAECIKCWLLHKNVCPMCRATALKV